jgi:hypothetical protein
MLFQLKLDIEMGLFSCSYRFVLEEMGSDSHWISKFWDSKGKGKVRPITGLEGLEGE